MRKELWFGVTLMTLIVGAVIWFMPAPGDWTNGHLGLLMLALIVVAIMLGFPTAFTLMGMGVLFSWLAYLVERSNLIEKLFRSLHLALAWIPGSLAVATLVTCAIFATATGIVGAVVTLMGLLAFPAMLRAGYSTALSAGAVTAGGCLGILIPPSVLLIVYGATAGVSVVQLYAGAFFPGLMLTGLYILYILIIAKLKPSLAPPLPEGERAVPLPPLAGTLQAGGAVRALPAFGAGMLRALKGPRNADVPTAAFARQLGIVLLPALAVAVIMGSLYEAVTTPAASVAAEAPLSLGGAEENSAPLDDLQAPPDESPAPAPDASARTAAPAAAPPETPPETSAAAPIAQADAQAAPAAAAATPAPRWFWITLGVVVVLMAYFYWRFSFARLEIFKMLLASFFPLALLILAVLGSIVFGLATPTEAAAVGSLGGALLAAAYRQLNFRVVKESVLLTAKTSAMVLGWPLEWTEIIIIFMPIFIPLLDNFGIDPLFFGLLVALNLQTAFLSPPVAMAAFYLKGVAPPHVTLNQIFLGMLPFMGIQLIALVLLYVFPGIGLWLPTVLYR
ncbi:TRAP transporter, DctM subunit [compost metagenome]